MLCSLKRRIANWLLKDITLEEIRARKFIDLGGPEGTGYFNKVRFDSLTADPTLEAGLIWFRSDLERLRYYTGTEIIQLDPAFPKENTPKIVQGNANSTSYVTLVDVSGSGYLTSVSAFMDSYSGTIRLFAEIIIDGTTVITDALVGVTSSSQYYGSANPIAGLFRFESSLKVNIRESYAVGTSRFIVGYILASALEEKLTERKEIVETPENTYEYTIEEWIASNGRKVTLRHLTKTIPKRPRYIYEIYEEIEPIRGVKIRRPITVFEVDRELTAEEIQEIERVTKKKCRRVG